MCYYQEFEIEIPPLNPLNIDINVLSRERSQTCYNYATL